MPVIPDTVSNPRTRLEHTRDGAIAGAIGGGIGGGVVALGATAAAVMERPKSVSVLSALKRLAPRTLLVTAGAAAFGAALGAATGVGVETSRWEGPPPSYGLGVLTSAATGAVLIGALAYAMRKTTVFEGTHWGLMAVGGGGVGAAVGWGAGAAMQAADVG